MMHAYDTEHLNHEISTILILRDVFPIIMLPQSSLLFSSRYYQWIHHRATAAPYPGGCVIQRS